MTNTARTAVIIGVGPGLGMSMARKFGREGYRIALISRSDTRHGDYLADLSALDIEATAHAADVTDPDRFGAVIAEIAAAGDIEVVYYGPAAGQPLFGEYGRGLLQQPVAVAGRVAAHRSRHETHHTKT